MRKVVLFVLALVARRRRSWELYKSLGPETGGKVLGWNDPAQDVRQRRCRTCGTWPVGSSTPRAGHVGHARSGGWCSPRAWFSFRLAAGRLRRSARVVGVGLAVRDGPLRASCAAACCRTSSRRRPCRSSRSRRSWSAGAASVHPFGWDVPRWMAVSHARRRSSPSSRSSSAPCAGLESTLGDVARADATATPPRGADAVAACASRRPCRRWCRRSGSAASAAVVGVVVAEISTGLDGGIGRLIIEYGRQATSDPAKVYTAVFGAAALGL